MKPPDSDQNFLISNIERAEESKLVRKLTLRAASSIYLQSKNIRN